MKKGTKYKNIFSVFFIEKKNDIILNTDKKKYRRFKQMKFTKNLLLLITIMFVGIFLFKRNLLKRKKN